jgi:hypothetical protein
MHMFRGKKKPPSKSAAIAWVPSAPVPAVPILHPAWDW